MFTNKLILPLWYPWKCSNPRKKYAANYESIVFFLLKSSIANRLVCLGWKGSLPPCVGLRGKSQSAWDCTFYFCKRRTMRAAVLAYCHFFDVKAPEETVESFGMSQTKLQKNCWETLQICFQRLSEHVFKSVEIVTRKVSIKTCQKASEGPISVRQEFKIYPKRL